SRGNTIQLGDDAETVRKKVMSMYTDPTRLRATDPGHVEGNPVFEYHEAFNSNTSEVDDFKERYRAGQVGDVEVKKSLVEAMNSFLDPIREKRSYYEAHLSEVEEALMEGTRRARVAAAETMKAVRDAMKISSYTSTWE
ncbi:MAG: tryptophan--tRNA ligase, partial [Dehalococcoidia bacterium]